MQPKYDADMKIKLIRTGGLMPIKKVAQVDADLSETLVNRFINFLKSAPPAKRFKDGTNYNISLGNEVYPLNIEKLPDEFRELVDELKNNLKTMKPT
jgi:hypothetical protein